MRLIEFQMKIKELLPDLSVSYQESLSKHTSFKIGGPVSAMAFPRSQEELAVLLRICNELKITFSILGAGTNILAPDEGMDQLIICLKNSMDGMEQLDATHVRIAAGVTMSRAAVFAAGLGLSGMEFAHGIPGTVGGGVYMNAGAYGGEISTVCVQVEAMDETGNRKIYSRDDLHFSYRHSIFEENHEIVLNSVFELQPLNPEAVKAVMRQYMERRSASQPLDMPSAGSAFKRPSSGYAAALIDQCGLKGFSVGGAAVSVKHAGFVVNNGSATAADVQQLLQKVSDIVFDRTGIRLEPEIRIWKNEYR